MGSEALVAGLGGTVDAEQAHGGAEDVRHQQPVGPKLEHDRAQQVQLCWRPCRRSRSLASALHSSLMSMQPRCACQAEDGHGSQMIRLSSNTIAHRASSARIHAGGPGLCPWPCDINVVCIRLPEADMELGMSETSQFSTNWSTIAHSRSSSAGVHAGGAGLWPRPCSI